jgi:hypothetical protein
MRRILLPLIAVAVAYCAYLTTMPAPVTQTMTAVNDDSPRVTREITLPSRKLYAACLGRYDSETTARVEAARLTARGAAGCVRADDGEFAVLGAVYDTQGDAGSVCRRISREEGMDATVLHCAADALKLRVTAGETQLTAMENAISMLERTPSELSELSYQLDSGEMAADTARALISVMYTSAAEVATGLETAARGTSDRFCLALCHLTDEICAALEHMCAPDGPEGLALSSEMKNAAISARLGVMDMMEKLR